ncbi:MAG TPA: alpha/beta hydrolase [Actinoplanes sp.]|nr:alpha/beta hydrolase [Actinoplanes sp.]
MTTAAITYSRLRVTDPARWLAAALAWRRWATVAGGLGTDLGPLLSRLRDSWAGSAAEAAAARLVELGRRLTYFQVFCWRADQALSEFAASITRARTLLDQARTAAAGAGLVIDDSGVVRAATAQTGPASGTAQAGRASGTGRAGPASGAGGDPAAVQAVAAVLASALEVAATADASAAARLVALADVPEVPAVSSFPGCDADPAEVRRWWAGFSPAQRDWLLVTDAVSLAGVEGIPVADRDIANRLLLGDHRRALDTMAARGADPDRVRDLREGLDRLSARLADDSGPRAYLVGLGLADEGRAVVALGDPDRAVNVLTHVPGMTSDLRSLGGELTRAERVAVRAGELGPAGSTSAVVWLDYDAPDFLHEAVSPRQAREGAVELRRFQEGLRATHEGEPARQTVLGHSYGSLLVGAATAGGRLAADGVVFVGSPGVGVDSAALLGVPADQVWSTTSRTDVIQLARDPRDLLPGVVLPDALFGTERELWFGRNPSHPSFGGRVFASQAGAGHLGYWDEDRPALDAMARITLGEKP